jgi:hypothetical protein
VNRTDIPFNITLLELTPQKLAGLKPVKVLDIFEGSTTNFHEDGLFSQSIFGRVGDDRRAYRFSYIDVRITILHPVIYAVLLQLKKLYGEIMSGTAHATWDPVLKDFVRSTPADGQTGYQFFINRLKDLDFGESQSDSRKLSVALIEKYRAKCLTSKVVVLPAGLRDLEIDENNRKVEDEINGVYRRLIGLSNAIAESSVKNNPEILDPVRFQLQRTFNELYEMIESIIKGKKKLLLGKWASRRVFNGTRNVITAMDASVAYLGAPQNPSFNSTIIGLYQFSKASLPITLFKLRTGFLSEVFPEVSRPALLVNKKTLHGEEVMLHSRYFDQWATNEGLEKVLTAFQEESIRSKPLEINGHYLGLIYKGPDMTFRLLHSVDEVPEGRSKDDVHPLTFAELLYLAIYEGSNLPLYFTRYPVTGIGSIYPSRAHLRVTLKSEVRKALGRDWVELGPEKTAHEFPLGSDYLNSLVPHPAKLEGAGADFDGDTGSANVLYSDEAVAECETFFRSRSAYVGTNGKLISSTGVSTVNLVLHNMTGIPA